MRLLLVLALAAPALAQPADTLRATLDLRGALASGWLEPGAAVGLRGGHPPLTWGDTWPAADPDGDGLYTAAVPFLRSRQPLAVEVKIKVDAAGAPNGGWQEGANHTVEVPPGGADLRLAWEDRAVPPPGVVTGRVDAIEAVEGAGLAARTVYVWLPPGYDADADRRYPVLYLHDGQGVFGTETGAEWHLDETATALVETGQIEPVILVGVANTARRIDEYTPTPRTGLQVVAPRVGAPLLDDALNPLSGTYSVEGDTLTVAVRAGALVAMASDEPGRWFSLDRDPDGRYSVSDGDERGSIRLEFEHSGGTVTGITITENGGLADAYGRLLTDVVKPLIDARYRTLPDAAHTGLGGSSLGGLVTMHLGLARPDVFGRLWVASPSVWWADRAILAEVAAAEAPPGARVWVDVGTGEGDAMVPDARALAALLVQRGWGRVQYVEAEGAGHSASAWAERAPDALRFLFPPEE